MRAGGIISAVAHIVIFAIMIYGLPFFYDDAEIVVAAVPVEIVTPEQAGLKPKQEAKKKEEPKKKEPEKPKKEEAKKPPPPPPEPAMPNPVIPPEPPPVTPPEPEVAMAKPEPEPEPEPKKIEPEPIPEPKAELPVKKPEVQAPRPQQKPKPKPRPKPKTESSFDSVLNTVEKLKEQQTANLTPEPDPNAKAQETPLSIDERKLANDLVGMIRQQITPCWNIPAGAQNAENLIVTIKIHVNRTGTVRTATVLDQSRMATDPFFRSAGESALRAVLNPRCSPLKGLPQDKYSLWQAMTIQFDPSGMLGAS